MELSLLKNEYSVYRFEKDYKFSMDLSKYEFATVTRTYDETSVVCYSGSIKNFEKEEQGWRVLKICGELDFALVGVISKISALLAENLISIFVVSTYNTDYIMIKNDSIDAAIKALKERGYTFSMNEPLQISV